MGRSTRQLAASIVMTCLFVVQGTSQNRFTEEPVAIGSGWWELPGTLTVPAGAGKVPAVVLVHGSGPHDRDETVGPNKLFRDLAWGLANAGVAVLRYEKRTREYKDRVAEIPGFTVQHETIEDALLAVAALRGRDRIDSGRIFVIGHSLGGMLAPRIAGADARIAGLVILAGPTRPFPQLVVEQMEYLGMPDGGVIDPKLALAALKHEATRVMDPALSLDVPASELLMELPASYWRDLNAYHPEEAAARLRIPMLILQGERDYQVTLTDLGGWENALRGRANVTIKTYPGLNHQFMTGTGQSRPAEYNIPGHVSDEVIADIASWIARQP